MDQHSALTKLLTHLDPDVRAAAVSIRDAHNRVKEGIALARDNLTQLRLDVKYLMFDLEATRQERDELRSKE